LKIGIKSAAIALLHSYAFDEHEKAIGALCLELGFDHVSLSSQTVKMKCVVVVVVVVVVVIIIIGSCLYVFVIGWNC
jgi:hypothetical protein